MPFVKCTTKSGESGWKYGHGATWCEKSKNKAIRRAYAFEEDKGKLKSHIEKMGDADRQVILAALEQVSDVFIEKVAEWTPVECSIAAAHLPPPESLIAAQVGLDALADHA